MGFSHVEGFSEDFFVLINIITQNPKNFCRILVLKPEIFKPFNYQHNLIVLAMAHPKIRPSGLMVPGAWLKRRKRGLVSK
jgi:hypothetical protein